MDAAEAATVPTGETPARDLAPHPGVAAFVAGLVVYAGAPREDLVRRLARSPVSGLPRVDAAALLVAARDRGTFAEMAERGAVPLGAGAAAAVHAFVTGLAAVEASPRAQGATATELIRTIERRFDFSNAGERAATTLAIARDEAAAHDAQAASDGRVWEPAELANRLRSRFRHALGSHPVATPWPGDARAVRDATLSVEPEPATDVRRKRTHFSASALGMYASCERKWYYRYVCAAVEDPGSSASFYGTAFHWALERFHERVKRASDGTPEELERELDGHVAAAFARFRSVFETPIEYEVQIRRARRTAKRYLRWFLARSVAAPFAVIGTETEAALTLDGYDFVGYIDRLDRDDRTGAVTVVDYKTGSIARSAREYRADVANHVDFQLPFYYWARTAAGDRVTHLTLVPLKDALREVSPVELEVVPSAAAPGRFDDPRGTIGIDELTTARAKIIEHARRLTDETIEHFPVTRDASACTYCVFADACRDRPAAGADRFGR